MMIVYILLAILLLYILFIVIPAILIYNFAFGRKPCSAPLSERELIGTRYEPFIDILVPAEHFVQAQPSKWVSVFARDGVELRGRYFDNRSDKTMLFVHGYCGAPISNFCAQAERFYKQGWNLMFLVQRAHGESGGKRLGLGVLEQHDIPVWVDFCANMPGVEKIVVYGSSMGASAVGYASDAIHEPKVKALVIDCGFVAPRNQLEHDGRIRHLPYPLLITVMRVLGKLDFHEDIYERVSDSLRKTGIPVLFLHGEADPTVDIAQGYENYNACASEKEFISVPGASHILAYVTGGEKVWNQTDAFINRFV